VKGSKRICRLAARAGQCAIALVLVAASSGGCALAAQVAPADASRQDSASNGALQYVADRMMIEELIVRNAKARSTTDPDLRRQLWISEGTTAVLDNQRLVTGGAQGSDQPAAQPTALSGGLTAEQQRFNPGYRPGAVTYGIMRHVVSNIDIAVTGDAATADYYVLTYANNPEAQRPELISVARNADEFVRRDGRWFIKGSRLNYDWGNDEMARKLRIGPYSPGLPTPPAPPPGARP
jgi:hypothetical protein